MTALFELALLLGFLALAFWQKDIVLYVVTAIISILLAADWVDSYPGISVAIFTLGVYLAVKVIIMVFETGGYARGMSQFKGVWAAVKGLLRQ